MEQNEIMTLEEVARYLKIAERTVYAWAQKKKIPGGKIGSVWRFRRSEIARWVDGQLDAGPVQKGNDPVSIKEVLRPECVRICSEKNKEDLLTAMVKDLAGSPVIGNGAEFRQAILDREELMSTGIGLGVGVPHVRLASVAGLVMGVGICPDGIPDYDSIDGEPVRIIHLIGANKEQSAEYIRLLARISAKMKDRTLRQKLVAAKDERTIYDLMVN